MRLRLIFRDMMDDKGRFRHDAARFTEAGDCQGCISSHIRGRDYIREFDGDGEKLNRYLTQRFGSDSESWTDRGAGNDSTYPVAHVFEIRSSTLG